jgi:hypothetical protein
MGGVDDMLDTIRAVQVVVDMYFLEHAYGTPAESYALSCRIVQHLVDEGRLP